jgi:hypothetical protein
MSDWNIRDIPLMGQERAVHGTPGARTIKREIPDWAPRFSRAADKINAAQARHDLAPEYLETGATVRVGDRLIGPCRSQTSVIHIIVYRRGCLNSGVAASKGQYDGELRPANSNGCFGMRQARFL